jgi:hypothetical protein
VKADKRGTMMMVATIFGLFVVLKSRVARVLNIATVPIISLSRAKRVSAELPGSWARCSLKNSAHDPLVAIWTVKENSHNEFVTDDDFE